MFSRSVVSPARVFSVATLQHMVAKNKDRQHVSSDEIDSIEESVERNGKSHKVFASKRVDYTSEGEKIHALIAEIENGLNEPSAASKRELRLFGSANCNWVLVPAFYFMLGAYLATPALALNYYAIRALKINPASFGFLSSLVVVPWWCKSFLGSISDSRPFFGLHRVPYLLVCSLGCMLTWIMASIPGAHSETAYGFGALMLLANFFICFSDVVVDCMIAKMAREEIETSQRLSLAETRRIHELVKDPAEAEKLSAAARDDIYKAIVKTQFRASISRNIGSIAGMCLGAYLVETFPQLQITFAVTAVYPLLLFIGSFFLTEERDENELATQRPRGGLFAQIRESFERMYENQALVNLAKFVVIFTATPSSGVAFRYYLINELKLSEAFMGRLSVASVFAALLGLAMYRMVFYRLEIRMLLRMSVLFGTAISAAPILLVTGYNASVGVPAKFLVFGDDVAEAFSGELAMMPIKAVISSVCPNGDEGVVYSGFMSLLNIGGAVSTLGGSLLTHYLNITSTDYTNLWILTTICTVAGFLPFFFAHWVPTLETHAPLAAATEASRKHRDANSVSVDKL